MQVCSDSKNNLPLEIGISLATISRNRVKIKNTAGFTLIEVMVCIAIIAVLAAVAIPAGMSWRRNAQFNSAVRDVKGNMELTRMFAIRSNLQADVDFVNGANTFNTVRRSRNGGLVQTNTQVHQLPPGITIANPNFFGGGATLQFNNRGMATNGTVTLNGPNGLTRDIVVTVTGNSQVQ